MPHLHRLYPGLIYGGSGGEITLKVLRIAGIAALVLWLAFITARIEDTRRLAGEACNLAATAASANGKGDMLDGCR